MADFIDFMACKDHSAHSMLRGNNLVLQNGLGIVLAGGLGGYVVLQRQGKEKLEEELSGKISSEQQNVQSLKDEVGKGLKLSPSLHSSLLHGQM